MSDPLKLALEKLSHISETNRHDLIEKYAKDVLALDATNLYALEILALSYNNSRRYEDLKPICEEGIRLWPNEAHFYYIFHLYYLARGGSDYVHARDLLRTAIRLEPKVGLYYRELAEVYLINWEPQTALRLLETAVKLSPSRAEYQARMALAILRTRQLDKAFATARRALSMEPGNEAVLNSVGQVLLFGGELDEAESLFREALRLYPTYDYYQRQLENCLREKKDRENRLRGNKKYTPLVLRQKGSKRFFDDNPEARTGT